MIGPARRLPKFRAPEIIDRVANQAWEQAAYYLAGKLHDRTVRAGQLRSGVLDHRAEQDNEESHVLVLDEFIAVRAERENWFRFRLLPQVIAFAVYQQFWLLPVLRPAWAFRFNADIEDHAEHEYAEFAAEEPGVGGRAVSLARGARVRDL